MLRPNSFSLFPYFINLVSYELPNHRLNTAFFRLQNASCWLVVVASSLFSYVAHTCIIINIYFECRGVIFSFFVFLVRSPYFELLSYPDYGTFLVIPNILTTVLWWWKSFFSGADTRSAQTKLNVDKEKNAWMNFAVAFRCSTRNMKNSVVHSKIVFHIRGLHLVKFYLFLSL